MAGDNNIGQNGRRPWRDVVQSSIGRIERLKRNVLEISFEKRNNFDDVEEGVLANFFKNIGIRKEHVEGVQLVPVKIPQRKYTFVHRRTRRRRMPRGERQSRILRRRKKLRRRSSKSKISR